MDTNTNIETTRYKLNHYLAKKLIDYDVYAVESEVDWHLTYVTDFKSFALLKGKEAIKCDFNEAKSLINKLIPEVKKEALETYSVMLQAKNWRRYDSKLQG